MAWGSGEERGQRISGRVDNEVGMTLRLWLRAHRLKCGIELFQMGVAQLQEVLAWLELRSKPEPASRLAGHLDMSAQNERNGMSGGKRSQSRDALPVRLPTIDHQKARINRVPGQQDLRVAVVQRDMGVVMP